MKKIGIAALVSEQNYESFLNQNWPDQPFIIHGLGESVRELTELSFLKSLDSLLNTWPFPVSAHLPDVRDESSAIDTTTENAKKLFSNHMGLLFNNVQRISPVLQIWLKTIKLELGLPLSTDSRCMVYATADGKGTAPHFDQNINFVLQLHGTKTWWIEPNLSVENPTQRFTMNQAMDPELDSYAESEMPTKMSTSREEVILKPGSMLFVPRGYWHSTEASGEALALNFTFSQPTWVDLFTAALRSRLLQSPDWRDHADGINATDPERRKMAEIKFDHLLAELVTDLPNWTAGEILAATEGDR